MVQKKIDNRIRTLIENGVVEGHRTMFVVVGENGRDQVMVLHQMLSKAAVKARPNVLWCYKKDLGFSSHRKKRMKNVQDKIKAGKVNMNEDDPFELFIGSTNIRYCYYSETQKILGNTYGMCVLQDFEALTPNLLARTIETVEGGGLIVLLLQGITSTRQLYTMAMDIHDRYRTEAHNDIVGRFNERFLLSLPSCSRCLVVDDQLTVLPLSSHVLDLKPVNQRDVQAHGAGLKALKENMSDTQLVGCLINCCKTLDQGKAVLRFIEALTEKTLRATVSLTASRGRGKSAALGLAVAGSIAFGYSNIFVTSPSPENLKTFFEFVFKGLDALGYCEHLDYGLVQSTNPEHDKALIRVNVYRNTRQTIQYIHPSDANKLLQAELLVIDEAAAIPLPYVRDMLGPYLVFLASTINGYEGTGRSLSLKLLQQLREQTADRNSHIPATNVLGRTLCEVELEESIRYRPQDAVEKWLYEVLCLDATSIKTISSGTPPPNECFLYYVNRDTLFCYHKASETFLQRLVSLFVSSHYKNSPNDLQMMSDAPAHNIFVLLGPVNKEKHEIPDVLCAIQTCFEGQLSRETVSDSMTRGKKAAGDLIPWTMAQQFQDEDFPSLCGVRIVRIATHPNYQSMGYGSRALKLLKDYFDMKMPYLDKSEEHANYNTEINYGDILTEKLVPRETLPPLLQRLDERRPEDIDYIGTSFGLTLSLLKFWKRAGFIPVYVRQTPNELTGEHSCIMLRANPAKEGGAWLPQFWEDFCRRFTSLLSYRLRVFTADVALCIIQNQNMKKHCKDLSKWELDVHLTKYDIKRIELYCNNMVDYHLIMDLLPVIGTLLFTNKMGEISLSALQRAIMLGLGLQRKTVEQVASELNLPSSQLLGIFNRMMRKVLQYLTSITEQAVEESLGITNLSSEPQQTTNTLPEMNEELENANKEMKSKQKKELKKLKKEFSDKFAIQGTDEDWDKALMSGVEKGTVTIKSSKRKLPETNNEITETPPKKEKKKKRK